MSSRDTEIWRRIVVTVFWKRDIVAGRLGPPNGAYYLKRFAGFCPEFLGELSIHWHQSIGCFEKSWSLRGPPI